MKNIKVYSRPGCGACRASKMVLQSNNAEFTEINVDEDQAGFDYLVSQNISSLPLIEIDGVQVIGFQPNKIIELIKD